MLPLDPTFFFTQLANALIIGVIYALMALGLTLIFGIMKIVNFAHGEVYMVGGYAYYVAASLAGIDVYVSLVLAIGTAALVGLAIERFLISPSYTGKVRAVSQDREAALVVGINANRMNALTFTLGCALGGAAGALTSPIFLAYPDMGTFPGIKGFVIIVLGGMGSVPGSIIGSILLGLVEVFTSAYIPDPRRAFAYRDIYGLIILVLVLLLRPSGLLGEKGRKA